MSLTRTFHENEIIFHAGDPATGMYVIRSGSVKVFLENKEGETTLAILSAGSIFGEMAFFDNGPRSASVKAIVDTEVTEISKAEFQIVLKTIPKWFVSIMQLLILRLRDTSAKLKLAESGEQSNEDKETEVKSNVLAHQQHPYQHTINTLKILILTIAKTGLRDGKDLFVSYDEPNKIWDDFFPNEKDLFEKIVQATEKTGLIIRKKGGEENKDIIVIANKGTLVHFVNFFAHVFKNLSLREAYFPSSLIRLVTTLVEIAETAGMPDLTILMSTLVTKGKELGKDTTNWESCIHLLVKIPQIKLTRKTSDVAIIISTKELRTAVQYLKLIKIYFDSGLA